MNYFYREVRRYNLLKTLTDSQTLIDTVVTALALPVLSYKPAKNHMTTCYIALGYWHITSSHRPRRSYVFVEKWFNFYRHKIHLKGPIINYWLSSLTWQKILVDWLSWGLTTRQPLWVILCHLPEKGTKVIEEIAEEMKEREREERETGWKWRNRRNKNIPPLPLPATRTAGLAQL